jgi:23S rRNA pseudoU1915 N3-methylase RlmH
MKVSIYSFGKIKNPNYHSQIEAFYKQILKKSKGIKFNRKIKPDRHSSQKQNALKLMEESQLPASQTYVLAEWGEGLSTAEFINLLIKKQNFSQDVCFLCGNAFGWERNNTYVESKNQLKTSHLNYISLSKMTYNHELAQVMLFEQLYRFVDHINGGNYAK